AGKTRWVFAAAAVVALAGLALAPQLAGTHPVVPVLADKTLVVHWSAIAGTSDQEMSRITEAAADELRTLPGVANVGGHIGRAITSDQVGDVSSGELWVTVAPEAAYADTAAAVDRVIAGYAGLTSKVSTYPQERIDQIREEADSGFAVRVFGLDPAILRQKAAEVKTILEHTAGVANPHVDLPAEQPIAEVKVNLAAAQKAGVVPGDVRRAAAALLQGIEVGNLYEEQKVFSVIVKGAAATRSSLDSVRNLIIDTPNGGPGKTRWVFAAAAVVALAGLALAPQLAGTHPVVPVLADKTLVVHWSAIAGTSDQEMSRITEAAADELRTLPGVANVGGHIGRAITSDQVGDVSSGELWVTVAPEAAYADTAAAVDRVIAGYAGLTSKVSTYPQERIDQIREEADSGFAVRVFGLDPAILRQKAAEVKTILEHTAGVANPHVDLPAEQPIAEVKVNLAAAQKAGVVPGDVRRAAAALLQGIEVGNLYEEQKVFSVIVKGAAATRSSLDSVRNLIIDTPNG
ncbi:efflux RND transporter permease subunit, partial [Arthrobacter sp. I3]|uniref:efflux RND transporter permease subunit n=1 Tax=Arthrobacter sp. I3 TaxID=218158 RepID=UPI0020A6BF2C